MTLTMTDQLDDIIETFEREPFLFDHNVYVCYEACKKIIALKISSIAEYDECIEYITERLKI